MNIKFNHPIKPNLFINTNIKLIIFISLFFISLLVFHQKQFRVAWDLADYLTCASNIAQGNGFVNAFGEPQLSRPGFKLLLAGVISIFGHSLGAVAWFIEAVSALLVGFIFLLGTRLYNIRIGVFSSALFLFSPQLIFWIPRHLDPFWPVFIIASILCILILGQKNETYWGILSGCLTAVAILIKETSCLILLAPLFLFWLRALPGTHKRILWYYIGSAVPLIVWLGIKTLNPTSQMVASQYSWQVSQLQSAGEYNFLKTALAFIIDGARGLWLYFGPSGAKNGLFRNFPLALFMLIGFGWVVWNAAKRKTADQYLAVIFLVFLPFYAIIGDFNLRIPQNLIGISLLYICMTFAVIKIQEYIVPAIFKEWKYFSWLNHFISLIIICLLIVLNSMFDEKGFTRLVRKERSNAMAFMKWSRARIDFLKLPYSFEPRKISFSGEIIAEWLDKNDLEENGLLMDHEPSAHSISWYSEGKKNIGIIPFKFVGNKWRWPSYERASAQKGQFIYVTALSDDISRINMFFLLDWEEFKSIIIENKVKYISVSQFRSLNTLFQQLPCLDKRTVLVDQRKHTIYEVNDNIDKNCEYTTSVMIDKKAARFLRNLTERDQERYSTYKSGLLEQVLGFTDVDISNLLDGRASPKFVLMRE